MVVVAAVVHIALLSGLVIFQCIRYHIGFSLTEKRNVEVDSCLMLVARACVLLFCSDDWLELDRSAYLLSTWFPRPGTDRFGSDGSVMDLIYTGGVASVEIHVGDCVCLSLCIHGQP